MDQSSHPLWVKQALRKRQLPARIPPSAPRVSLFSALPQLLKKISPSCSLSSLGCATAAKPQPLAILSAHPGPRGAPPRPRPTPRSDRSPCPRPAQRLRERTSTGRTSPVPGPAPPSRTTPTRAASSQPSTPSHPFRAARTGRGGACRPGPCPGGRGHREGQRAPTPKLRAPVRPQPEGNAANSRGFHPGLCVPPRLPDLWDFLCLLPASLSSAPEAPASSPLCTHYILCLRGMVPALVGLRRQGPRPRVHDHRNEVRIGCIPCPVRRSF